MIVTTEKIEYGKEIIKFELLQEDRKTLSIEVLPTTKIKVKAPESKNKQDIIKKVQNKAKWITKQKRYFVDNYKKPDEKRRGWCPEADHRNESENPGHWAERRTGYAGVFHHRNNGGFRGFRDSCAVCHKRHF